jgi:hypothetical protein
MREKVSDGPEYASCLIVGLDQGYYDLDRRSPVVAPSIFDLRDLRPRP